MLSGQPSEPSARPPEPEVGVDGAGQRPVVDFLSSPAAFGGRPVERIDTHISHIFLAGDRAYKMKRAVKLDFLDYTGLELRRRDCLAEIAVNQAMAAGLYRRVVAVTRAGDGLALGGPGEPVEWLVEMVRFDGGTQFDRLADAGRLTAPMIEQLADVVAAGHRTAPVTPDRGGVDVLAFFLDYVGRALDGAVTALGGRDAVDGWKTLFGEELRRMAPVIDARRRHGFVRRCHGDLHLANICLFDGRATPFDAIEFNDAIACCDVLYDLAYALMDLVRIDRPDLANLLMNRYLAYTRDYRGLRLMPLFVSLRGGIRAMVHVLKPPTAAEHAKARAFLHLALDVLVHRPRPRLIAVGGLSGTGKSTLARALATRMAPGVGAVVLRSDVTRKQLFDIAPETPLPPEAYGPEVNERVYRRLAHDAGRALAAGQVVIVDAVFLQPWERAALAEAACRLDAPFAGLWLDAPRPVLAGRIAMRGNDASDATVAVLAQQARQDIGALDWTRLDAGGDVDGAVRAALAALG